MHEYSYLSPVLVYCSLEIHLGANTSNPFLSPNVTFIRDVLTVCAHSWALDHGLREFSSNVFLRE